MSNYEATRYDFDAANLTGIQGVNTGIIVPWSNASVPSGFLECNGQAVSRSTYSALFAVVSTTYGVGDGSTTFNVPDLTDRVAIGKSPVYALASTGGANAVTSAGNISGSADPTQLTNPVLAAHSHPGAVAAGPGMGQSGGGAEDSPIQGSVTTPQPPLGNAGGDSPHTHPLDSITFAGGSDSVLQPYLTVMYIIKT